MKRLFNCDACGESFWQTIEHRNSPPPEGCPICHGEGKQSEKVLVWKSRSKREKDARVQSMVADGKGPGYNANARLQLKSEEQVFRSMEAGSIFRAEMAASDLGVPVSEVSDLKITNMRDNVKPGETSAIVPMSQTGIQMRDQASRMSFAPGAPVAPSAYAGAGTIMNAGTPQQKQVGTLVGPAAGYHGATTMGGLVQGHAARAAQVQHRGQLNKE